MNYLPKEISSSIAWDILKQYKESYLIDVRTDFEWDNFGFPDLSGISKNLIKESWSFYPSMEYNENFYKNIKEHIKHDNPIMIFICKSGIRSLSAANYMIQKNYINCYNITSGFNSDSEDSWINSNIKWKRN